MLPNSISRMNAKDQEYFVKDLISLCPLYIETRNQRHNGAKKLTKNNGYIRVKPSNQEAS